MNPIGKALTTAVTNGKLVQRWQFASDCNPVAKIAAGLYRGGFLRACSVGFIPQAWQDMDPSMNGGCNRKFTQQELLEVSAVGIPANPNALASALKSGAIDRGTLKEAFLLLTYYAGAMFDLAGTGPESQSNPKTISVPKTPVPHASAQGQAEEALERLAKQMEAVRTVLRRC